MKRGLPTIIFQFALSPLLFLLLITNVSAQQKAVETSGDVIYYATPVFCLATTLLKKDYQGTKQLIFSVVTAVGTSYILKNTVGNSVFRLISSPLMLLGDGLIAINMIGGIFFVVLQ